MAFSPATKAAILERDPYCLMACGSRSTEANHRANRGMGGSRFRDGYANACGLCNACNVRIESEAWFAEVARSLGVKLRSWQEPDCTPIRHPTLGLIQPRDDMTWETHDDGDSVQANGGG